MIKKLVFALLISSTTFFTFAQEIDLTNWKVTLPITKENGKLVELESPEIQNFEQINKVKPFFYRDLIDSAIVFHAYPAQTTRNTKYSRTELREQMEPGSNKVNWTFEQGGRMRGTLSVPEVTQKSNGDYHRVIIMQIHGRLSNEQRDLIGEDDNNAPPILKIYWDEGKIRVKTKVLKNPKMTDEELLHEKAWGDDKGRNFKEIVGTDKFTLEVNVSKGLMTITLNDKETFVYKGADIDRWGIFENYFKAGNYFQSRDEGSYAKVKYFNLEVTHSENNKYVKKKIYLKNEEVKEVSAVKSGFDPTFWKLELPSGYKASAWKLSNYEKDKFVKPFFYKDSAVNAIVMEAFEVENSTSKSKYIRNNLREQMQPGSNDVNWTMKKGGILEAEVQVTKMSTTESGKLHRTLLIQVDGKTSSKQTEELGLEKAVSMPFLKIYWEDGRIRVNRRILKDDAVVGDALLLKSSWKEDKGIYSRDKIDYEKVIIRVELRKGRVEIQINDEKPIVFKDFSVSQWYFENYFTVGNYLQTRDEGAHSIVKYYSLNVSHEKNK